MMKKFQIPFNKSNFNDLALEFIRDTMVIGKTSGDGKYTKLCGQY